MLRTGHLKVVSNVAAEVGSARHRVERQAAEVFTSITEVPSTEAKRIAEYLEFKHLCASEKEKEDDRARSKYRYSDLVVGKNDEGHYVRSLSGGPPAVWWQDFCLSDPRSRSMVGSVTAGGKAGSKTGLSHVFDWAESVGLISTSGQPTPIGRLLAKLTGKAHGLDWQDNPYILNAEKVLLGRVLIGSDLDVFSRFIRHLAASSFPLKKRSAARLFASTVVDLVEEVDRGAYLGPRQRFLIDELMRDLRKSARRNDMSLGDTSISWHRAASRLETYVDLGFLVKEQGLESHKYEYVYYRTELLAQVAQSVEEGTDPEEWIEDRLAAAIFGRTTADGALPVEELESLLPPILSAMRVASTAVPIDAVAVGLVQLAAERGVYLSLGAGRRSIEELAKQHPEIARLARGTRGERAEFVTIDPRRYS